MTAVPRCLRCQVSFVSVDAFFAHRPECMVAVRPSATAMCGRGQGTAPLAPPDLSKT